MFGTAFLYHLLASLVFVSRAQIEYFESCAMSPERYFYKDRSFTHSDTSSSSCESSTVQSETYLTCSQAAIHDGSTGPQHFNDSSPADYYTWTNDLNQVEFRFGQNVSFTKFKVYFYVHQNPNFALPKLRLLLLKDEVFPECEDPNPPVISDSIIDSISPDELTAGLHMAEANAAGTSTTILLCILPSKRYTLALTEIEFCTRWTTPVTSSPSQQSPPQVRSDEGLTQASKDVATSVERTTGDLDVSRDRRWIQVGTTLGACIFVLAVAVVTINVAMYILHNKCL